MALLIDNRTLGAKIETTKGTFEAVDFDLSPRDIAYTEEVEEYVRKLALGDHGYSESIMGRRSVTLTFSHEIQGSGAAGTAPKLGKLLRACGYKETVAATTSVTYNPSTEEDCTTISFDIRDLACGASKQVQTKIAGAMGSVTFVLDNIGAPIRADFEFKGKLVEAPQEINTPVYPTGFDTTKPPAVLGTTVSLGGVNQRVDKWEVSSGEDVQTLVDPGDASGWFHSYINAREMTATMDPESVLPGVDNIVDKWLTETIGIWTSTAGSTAGNIVTFTAPEAQITAAPVGDRNGAVTRDVTMRFLRDSGNDELSIILT